MAKPEEEQTMGKRLKQLIRQGVFLLVSSFSLITLAYAWFNYRKDGNADDIEFISIDAVGFEASLDGENYFDSLELEFPENLHMTPVSGDGRKGSMYYPVLPPGSDDPAEATSWVSVDYDENADDNAFYRVHVYFRADVAGYVALTGIYVDPLAAAENRQGSMGMSDNVDRPFEGSLIMPLYEDSSILTRDYMAAATRVSIMNNDCNETIAGIDKHLIVVPNAGYQLQAEERKNQKGELLGYCLSMDEEGTEDINALNYFDGTSKSSYAAMTIPVYDASVIPESRTPYVLQLKDGGDGWFRGEVDICLWIEGFDREALDIFADGRITMGMIFQYVETAPEE